MKKIVVTTLAVGLVGCASSPDSISAQYVSPLQYQSYSCDQLAAESQRIGTRVTEVTGQQQAKANSDAVATGVGAIVFWPALFFLGMGSDKKEELSRLKGENDAIQQAAIQKNCMTKSAT